MEYYDHFIGDFVRFNYLIVPSVCKVYSHSQILCHLPLVIFVRRRPCCPFQIIELSSSLLFLALWDFILLVDISLTAFHFSNDSTISNTRFSGIGPVPDVFLAFLSYILDSGTTYALHSSRVRLSSHSSCLVITGMFESFQI